MKLQVAAPVLLSSFLMSFVDAAVLRLRGHSGNHTQIEHHTSHTREEGCDEDCALADMFGQDKCTFDFSGMGYDVTCSGCAECQEVSSQASQAPEQGVKIHYKTLRYSGGRLGDGGHSAQHFVDAIQNSESGHGYCEQNLTEASWKNSQTCSGGSVRNVAFQISVDFDNHIGSTWHFNFGVDFGWGGVIYMDGQMMKSYAGDIWWSFNENHANNLGFGTFLAKGRHSLKVYGAEGCCDGPSRINFCANCEFPSNMEVLSVANVEKAVDHFMEMGSFEAGQFHAFTAAFEIAPVVVIEGGASGQIQVLDVTKTGFSSKSSGGASPQSGTALKYLAVEPGSHILPDGRIIESGTTTWSPPYNDHIFSFAHDFGVSTPAFGVTWVGSQMEGGAPGVASQLSATRASLSVPQPAQPVAEWRPPTVELFAVHRIVQTIGYVAMAKGEGQVMAKGCKVAEGQVTAEGCTPVEYNVTEGLFEWNPTSFVI